MLAVLHLAATLCTGFPIIYTPDWNLMPEVSATPTTPQPEHALPALRHRAVRDTLRRRYFRRHDVSRLGSGAKRFGGRTRLRPTKLPDRQQRIPHRVAQGGSRCEPERAGIGAIGHQLGSRQHGLENGSASHAQRFVRN